MKIKYTYLLFLLLLLTGCSKKRVSIKGEEKQKKLEISKEFTDLTEAKKYFNIYYQNEVLKLSASLTDNTSDGIFANEVNSKNYNHHNIKKTDTNGDKVADLYEVDLNEDKVYDLAYKYYVTTGELLNFYKQADVYVEQGKNYFERQMFQMAEDPFIKAVEIYYNHAEAHFYLGEIYLLYKKNLSIALEKYRTVYKIDPSYSIAIQRIKQVTAIMHLKSRLNTNPDCIEDRIKLGKLYQSVFLFEEAILEYQRVRRLKSDNYLINAYLGDIYANKNIIEKAELFYKEAIKLIPEHPYAYRNLGELYKNKGIKDNGKKEILKSEMLEKEIGVKISNPSYNKQDFFNDVGEKYMEKGDMDMAMSYFQKSFEIDKNSNYKSYYNFGRIYQTKNNYNESEKWYKMSIEIYNEFEPALIGLGDLYFKNKNYKDAFPIYKKLIQINPYNADYHCYLGIVYKQLNMKEPAKEEFQKSMEFIPSNENAAIIKKYLKEFN